MTVSVGWYSDQIIDVEISDLTFDRVDPVTSRSIYKLNIDTLRRTLSDLYAAEEGAAAQTPYFHETETTFGGVTYARKIQILSPYKIRFEDGQYAVEFEGANNNVQDVAIVNQVQLRPNNSTGLSVPQFNPAVDTVEGSLTYDEAIRIILAANAGKLSGAAGTTVSIRDAADSKDRIVATVDSSGNRTSVTLDGS